MNADSSGHAQNISLNLTKIHKDLEKLVFHESFYPAILELTDFKPQLRAGSLIANTTNAR